MVTHLKPFEIAVIDRLTEGTLSPDVLQAVIREGEFVEYDYTGYGYYLTFRHALLPRGRIVCSEWVEGQVGDVVAGFAVFLEANELMLECYPISGEPPIPADFREQAVTIG